MRLCQIASSAVSGNTSEPEGLSVTPAASRRGGEILLTPPLRDTESRCDRPQCGNTLYKSYMTRIQSSICYCAALITSTLGFLFPLPCTPGMSSLKAPAALNSIYHRKKRQKVRKTGKKIKGERFWTG